MRRGAMTLGLHKGDIEHAVYDAELDDIKALVMEDVAATQIQARQRGRIDRRRVAEMSSDAAVKSVEPVGDADADELTDDGESIQESLDNTPSELDVPKGEGGCDKFKLLDKMYKDLDNVKREVKIMISNKDYVPPLDDHAPSVTREEIGKFLVRTASAKEDKIQILKDLMDNKLKAQHLYSKDLVDYFERVADYAEKIFDIVKEVRGDETHNEFVAIEIGDDEDEGEDESLPKPSRERRGGVAGTMKQRALTGLATAAAAASGGTSATRWRPQDIETIGGGKKSKRKKNKSSKRKKRKSSKRKKTKRR